MSSYNIVIGHQDTVYAASLNQLLEEEGYTIDAIFHDAFKVLTHIIKYQPAMAIIDHRFPYLSADDIVEAVERKGIPTVVVVVYPKSYKGTPKYRFYIRQPFGVRIFLEKIEHWLAEYATP